MTNPWFKFYGIEYLGDRKINSLTGDERSCWITLLALASSESKDGTVKKLEEKTLFEMAGVKIYTPIFKTLQDLDMISVGNGIVTVLNWEKRQYSESLNRVREFRKREGNEDVTTYKNRKEKKREEEKRELPPWLNKKAWETWEKYRKEIKKKLTPTTVRQQLRFLEENKSDHTEIIRKSITNGWTGLFPLKEGQRKPNKYVEPNLDKETNDRRNELIKQFTGK